MDKLFYNYTILVLNGRSVRENVNCSFMQCTVRWDNELLQKMQPTNIYQLCAHKPHLTIKVIYCTKIKRYLQCYIQHHQYIFSNHSCTLFSQTNCADIVYIDQPGNILLNYMFKLIDYSSRCTIYQ